MWRRIGLALLVIASAIAVPAAGAALLLPQALDQVYPAPLVAPPASAGSAGGREFDPAKPTVAIVLGNDGTNAADTLAPFEVFARTRAFNVATVAPIRVPVPLTGGLDLVPDFSFAELRQRLTGPPDVIVVPQLNGSTSTVVQWLKEQHAAGAPLIMSVCVGAEVLADAGLLTGRQATSHWLKLIGLRRSHPEVRWVEGHRFVDLGPIITTGGVLSGVDGSLRIVERLAGANLARRVATEMHWSGYLTGHPNQFEPPSPAPGDLVALLSAGWRWDRPTVGVLLTDGVGEIELAAAFRPYTELSYLARLRSITPQGQPIRSRHGLTFLPRSTWNAAGPTIDRLLVPGHEAAHAEAAQALPGLGAVTYLHTRDDSFPFDAALQDIAATYDASTAAWVAKSLQYPAATLPAGSDGWPWALTGRMGVLAAAGAAVALILSRLRRRGPKTPAAESEPQSHATNP